MRENREAPVRPLNGGSVTNLFVFFLIGLFAVLAVTLTMIGMRAYSSLREASMRNSEGQVALSYLLNKTRAVDRAGAVSVREAEGYRVLCLTDEFDGERYETRIYYGDGALREYYSESGEAFDPELGEALCDLEALDMELKTPGLLYVEAVPADGVRQCMHIALRAGEAEP